MNTADFKKKLTIGSANFTQKYGADLTKINRNEIKKILNFSKKNKIKKIDTAVNYLNQKNIFKKINKTFQFTTKITPDYRWVSLDYCQKKIDTHFKMFNRNEIKTLLFHDLNILFKDEGKKIFANLEILKKKKYYKNIGISIYDTKCLSYMMQNYNFDVIQCPYNILDKRIVHTGWFSRLKKRGIEVHVRSVFLQGLLVNEAVYKKRYFKKWQKYFFEWFQTLKNKNISPIDYCLSDLLNHDFDQVIIGINNCDDLKDIINFKIIKNKIRMLKSISSDLRLIDPRNWRLNET